MYLSTGVIIFITLLNIFVYYLRERHEEEDGDCAERKNYPTLLLSDHPYRRFSLADIKSGRDSLTEKEVVDVHNKENNAGLIIEASHWEGISHVKSQVIKMSRKCHLQRSACSFHEKVLLSQNACNLIISSATDNFAGANTPGEGGLGPVYKGWLGNGQVIAVKILSADCRQGEEEFRNEIKIVGKVL